LKKQRTLIYQHAIAKLIWIYRFSERACLVYNPINLLKLASSDVFLVKRTLNIIEIFCKLKEEKTYWDNMGTMGRIFSVLVYYLKCLPCMEPLKVSDEEGGDQVQERKPGGWKTMPYILGDLSLFLFEFFFFSEFSLWLSLTLTHRDRFSQYLIIYNQLICLIYILSLDEDT
jgi:hypothetical protein